MHDSEMTSAPVATGASMLVYGITLSDLVLLGWLAYIAVCLIPKIRPACIEVRRWIRSFRK